MIKDKVRIWVKCFESVCDRFRNFKPYKLEATQVEQLKKVNKCPNWVEE